MKKIKFLLMGLILLAACSGGNTPSDVATLGSKYLKNKQFDKFASLVAYDKEEGTDPKQQQVLMAALLSEKYSKMAEKNGGIKDFKILTEEISQDGQHATVDVEYTYGDGSKSNSETDLVMQDGKWKIEIKK